MPRRSENSGRAGNRVALVRDDDAVGKPRSRGRRSFAEMVRDVTVEPSDPQVVYRNLAVQAEFVDDGGTRWTRRGQVLEGRDLARTLRRPEVVVVHDHLGEVTEVPPEQRRQFWQTAKHNMATSSYSHFYGTTFTSPQRSALLVVHEDC